MQDRKRVIWLNDSQVDSLLTPEAAYEAVRGALECHAAGDYQQPLKPYVRPPGPGGEYTGNRAIAMPAYLGGPFQVMGLKWISGFPANVVLGLPRASGVLVLNSMETGIPLAVMECGVLSARRTAAVVALAFDHLAPPGPRRVAVVGAGPIGLAVLRALGTGQNRNIAEVRLCDLWPERAQQVADALRGSGLPPVQVFAEAQAGVNGANVVIPATTGSAGYLERHWLEPSWLIVALSLDDCTPELFLSADTVIVDDFDQCCREQKLLHRLVQAGRFRRDQVAAELGEVIAGLKPGRRLAAESIYVNPMGMAVEDLAVGVTVYRKAVAQGIGQVLD